MATDPNFVPVFGPNGAVLNVPTMTPEMQAKFERSQIPSSPAEIRHGTLTFVAVSVVILPLMLFRTELFELAQASPWWAGAFSGVIFAVLVGNVMAETRLALRRWELSGVSAQQRRYAIPTQMRWAFVIVTFTGWSALSVGMLMFFTSFGERMSVPSFLLAGTGFLLFGLNVGLYEFARRKGWISREADSAEPA